MKKIKSISIVFPLYKDKGSVKKMIFKSYKLLKKLNTKSEIVIVDDGCPQRSGYYAKEISKKIKNVNIIFHKKT